jgi:lipase
VVCLHGVTGWGGHFARLAQEALPGFHVLAPDLLGHGRSPTEPPWSLRAQREAVLASVGAAPAVWIGHSLGGRLAAEIACERPELVERLVLLDPALVAGRAEALLFFAEDARTRKTYATFDELVDARFRDSMLERAPRVLVAGELEEHVVQDPDGRLAYRFVQSAVVASYAELAEPLTPLDALRAPTLLVTGSESYLPADAIAETLRTSLGDALEAVVVPAGHTVLWDALPEVAGAVAAFVG